MPLKELNSTTSLFDHTLRTKLAARGYTLSHTAHESYAIAYDIEKTPTEEETPSSSHDLLIFDMSGEEPVIIEKRTQEFPPLLKL